MYVTIALALGFCVSYAILKGFDDFNTVIFAHKPSVITLIEILALISSFMHYANFWGTAEFFPKNRKRLKNVSLLNDVTMICSLSLKFIDYHVGIFSNVFEVQIHVITISVKIKSNS